MVPQYPFAACGLEGHGASGPAEAVIPVTCADRETLIGGSFSLSLILFICEMGTLTLASRPNDVERSELEPVSLSTESPGAFLVPGWAESQQGLGSGAHRYVEKRVAF